MLPMAIAAGVRDGSVRCAFRRWERPRVRVGGTQLTSAGRIRFDAISEVTDLATLTDADARAAGVTDAEELRRRLAPDRVGTDPARRLPRASKGGDRVYRIELSWAGEDPRIELRTVPARGAELTRLRREVDQLDRGKRSGPWTDTILTWIGEHPGVPASELAALLGRDLLPMKADIRKLKALGLTESLRVGYRLSPRGVEFQRSLRRARRRGATRAGE